MLKRFKTQTDIRGPKRQKRAPRVFEISQYIWKHTFTFLFAADLARVCPVNQFFNTLLNGETCKSLWTSMIVSWSFISIDFVDLKSPKQQLGEWLANVPKQVSEAEEDAEKENAGRWHEWDFVTIEPCIDFGRGMREIGWSEVQDHFYGHNLNPYELRRPNYHQFKNCAIKNCATAQFLSTALQLM